VFSAFRSSRAVSVTPGERRGASTEPLPAACCLRPLTRGSASPLFYGATSEFAARYGPRFRSRTPAGARPTGPASAGCLATPRRGPRYPTAQRFIGVGSFHPTRNAPLSRRTANSSANRSNRGSRLSCRVAADSERRDGGSAKPDRRERSGSSVVLECGPADSTRRDGRQVDPRAHGGRVSSGGSAEAPTRQLNRDPGPDSSKPDAGPRHQPADALSDQRP
jgi:hypothetical protein